VRRVLEYRILDAADKKESIFYLVHRMNIVGNSWSRLKKSVYLVEATIAFVNAFQSP